MSETQPYPNSPERRNRVYVPAVWAPPGQGGGAPKLSGGYEVIPGTTEPAPRGWNRPDQRYELTAEELTARRESRADEEESTTVIVQSSGGKIDLRAPSGNNYTLAGNATECNCPDRLRLKQSGRETVPCKHMIIAQRALTSAGGWSGLPLGCARLAEILRCAQNTAEYLCRNGLIPAVSIHSVWVIEQTPALEEAVLHWMEHIVDLPIIPLEP